MPGEDHLQHIAEPPEPGRQFRMKAARRSSVPEMKSTARRSRSSPGWKGYGLIHRTAAWRSPRQRAVPSTTIHQGASGGILTASNRPVSRAELSFRVATICCLRSLRIAASVAQAVNAARTICSTVPQPKTRSGPQCQARRRAAPAA